MGLKDIFTKASVPDKEPILRDQSTILAYLEELSRLRTCVQIWFNKEDLLPVTARVELVSDDAENFTLSLQRSLPAEFDPRLPFEMLFPLDGMRFRCAIRFKDRGGCMKALFKIPECVYHAERREKVRTRFGQRENASATLLESLFEGHGASGKLLNLSLEGFCMRLEKAISIRDNKRLQISSNLFHLHQELMIVRILNLPHAPTIECGGMVRHIEDSPEGVTLGVHLDRLGTLESQLLWQVMTRRVPTFAKGFPQKRRRSEIEMDPHGAELADGEENTLDVEAPIEELPAEAPPEDVHSDDPADHADRMIRFRKRSRRILVVQLDDLDRAILAGTLLADGFTHVHEARNFSEAFHEIKTHTMDLLILEQTIGAIPVQQFLTQLRKLGHCDEVPVILVADHADVKLTIMAKAAHIAYVQPRPINYDGEMRSVVYGLLKLSGG